MLSMFKYGLRLLLIVGASILGLMATVILPATAAASLRLDSAAGGSTGFRLSGLVAPLALAGLVVPRFTRTLSRLEFSCASQMFVPLPERPG
jgi:hypothetical protein